MARNGKEGTGKSTVGAPRGTPRAAKVASDGVKTSREFASMMSTLMVDILENRIDPRAANAVCNAGGKLLRMVELEHKYGDPKVKQQERTLTLSE